VQSCRDITIGRNHLAAECLGPNGYQPTVLSSLSQGTQGVSNHFGNLICGVPAIVTVPVAHVRTPAAHGRDSAIPQEHLRVAPESALHRLTAAPTHLTAAPPACSACAA